MDDIWKITLTAAVTVFGGTLVFAFTQVLSRFFIEPCHEQRKTIGAIAETVLRCMPLISASGEELDATRQVEPEKNELRRLSSEMMARTVAIPCRSLLARIHLARGIEGVREAYRGLIGLSNYLHTSDWQRKLLFAEKVTSSLGIDEIDPDLAELKKVLDAKPEAT